MNKKLFVLSIVSVLFLAGAGCSNPSTTPSTDDNQNTTADTTITTPKDCGDDMDCGDTLIANCQPGIFTTVDGENNMIITVKNKDGVDCVVDSAIDLTGAPASMTSHDENKDGKLNLDCKIPSEITTYYELTGYLQTEAGLAGCSGETRTTGESL